MIWTHIFKYLSVQFLYSFVSLLFSMAWKFNFRFQKSFKEPFKALIGGKFLHRILLCGLHILAYCVLQPDQHSSYEILPSGTLFHIRSGPLHTCGPTQTVAKCVPYVQVEHSVFICVERSKQNALCLTWNHTLLMINYFLKFYF